MKHTDATMVPAANGYQSYAEANTNGTRSDEGGGNLLALICASFCRDSPLAEAYGANDNVNNNNAEPLMKPVQNGEVPRSGRNFLVDLQLCPKPLLSFTAKECVSVLFQFSYFYLFLTVSYRLHNQPRVNLSDIFDILHSNRDARLLERHLSIDGSDA